MSTANGSGDCDESGKFFIRTALSRLVGVVISLVTDVSRNIN